MKRILVSVSGATLFAVMFVSVNSDASVQEPVKRTVVTTDSTYVNAMRKPENWQVFTIEPAQQIKFGPKPKNPPIYIGNPKDWIEIPADSIHPAQPMPIVNNKDRGH